MSVETQIYINCEQNGTLTGQTFDILLNNKVIATKVSEGDLSELLQSGQTAIFRRMINASMGIKP